MDPTTSFCPNRHCPARGHTGQGNGGIHAQKEQRCICHACHTPFSARTGTVFSAAHLGRDRGAQRDLARPWVSLPAIVAALGFDERTIADWWPALGDRAKPCTSLSSNNPGPGQVQADARRVKQQGGLGGGALALRVTTRVWLGGEGSARDLPLIRRLMERVRRCAACRPLVGCPDAVVSSLRAMRETCRAPVHGAGRTASAASLAPWLHCPGRQARRAAAGGRDRPPPERWHAGTRGDAPTPVARRRRDPYRRH